MRKEFPVIGVVILIVGFTFVMISRIPDTIEFSGYSIMETRSDYSDGQTIDFQQSLVTWQNYKIFVSPILWNWNVTPRIQIRAPNGSLVVEKDAFGPVKPHWHAFADVEFSPPMNGLYNVTVLDGYSSENTRVEIDVQTKKEKNTLPSERAQLIYLGFTLAILGFSTFVISYIKIIEKRHFK